MKTVIVVDTDDPIGMENTRRMVDHLMSVYHKAPVPDSNDPFGTKISTIKTMREYVRYCKKNYPEDWEEAIGSLRASKDFVETLKHAQFAKKRNL